MYGNNYGNNSGAYTDEYGNQYTTDSYGNYSPSQYGSGGNYGHGYGQGYGGHQTRTPAHTPTSPTQLLPTAPVSRPGYGSPVPRRSNLTAVQIPIPTMGVDTGKRMDRYRSVSPGRRNAMVSPEQNMASMNIMNNNPYGRYDTCSSLSPSRNININPMSGVETPNLMRPSSVRIANVSSGMARSQSPHSPSRMMGSPSRNIGTRRPSYVATTPSYGNADLIQFFNNVDTDGSGRISWDELQRALSNGDWSEFDQRTCRLMISMFDTEWTGTINVREFSSLWKYINEWHGIFDSFDNDASGTIDARELHQAFLTFGYTIPPQFAQTVISIYNKDGRGVLKFDNFIEACCLLKLSTGRFDERDRQHTKRITLNMEQFIEMVMDTCLVNI